MTKRARPKITDPDLFALKRIPEQDDLKTTTEHHLSQSALGAVASKTLNYDGVISNKDVSLEYTKEMLEKHFKDVQSGDLSLLEEMLVGQAFALNMAFNSLAVRATRQKDVSTKQMLMNLCFKAQNQSRATIETLIHLKQPNTTTFVKQANIAQGHQQVNNFSEKNIIPQNEQLGVNNEGMDIRATATPKRGHKQMEAVGEINRSKNARRKS